MKITLSSFMAVEPSLADLHALCHDLGVEYGRLKGKGREAQARELFALLQAQGRLDELAKAVRQRHPEAFGRTRRIGFNRRTLLLGLAVLLIIQVVALAGLLARLNEGEQVILRPATSIPINQKEVLAEPSPNLPIPTPLPTLPMTGTWTISYAEADKWLENLAPEDHEDQILDWAVWGLADLLGLDTKALRDAFYDQTMVRDAMFDGLTSNPVGPGRGLQDGRGILHLLVPASGVNAERAIGMVLDDYRKDTGIDPKQVMVYRYAIDYGAQQVLLKPEGLGTAQTVRQAHGYREMQVDTLPALQRFLAETQHLSCLELRNGQLWAGGWSWPNVPGGQVTAQDLAVLQRGYRQAAAGFASEPGFSLDPGEALPVTETLDLIDPTHYPRLPWNKEQIAAFVTAWSQADTEQEQDRVLSEYSDLAQNWPLADERYAQLLDLLIDAAKGRSPYQRARYEGGLQGTETGMTYFYTDLVAKAWRMEKGSRLPTGQVPGFVSDLKAHTPSGHCKFEDESGRLWFGLREEAVSADTARIDLGSVATRVFTLIKDPVLGNQEVEPSYSFGRIIWWWDRHYLAIADYELQYHRLDQLMRWGAAIAWLVEQDVTLLPELPNAELKDDWQFGDWLAAHPELKWHFDVPFVNPPGQTGEALLTLYSEPFEDCGRQWGVSGGISNPPIERIVTIQQLDPNLGPEVARAGLSTVGTTYSPATQGGTIANLDGTLEHTLNPVAGNVTRVETVADGRKVWSMGTNKVWISETAKRVIGVEFSSESGRVGQRLTVQGLGLGELSAATKGSVATVRWQPGSLDHAERFLAALQAALPGHSLPDAIEATGDALQVYAEPGGSRVSVQLCDAGDGCWLTIEEGLREASARLAFRLGIPAGSEVEPTWYTATFQ